MIRARERGEEVDAAELLQRGHARPSRPPAFQYVVPEYPDAMAVDAVDVTDAQDAPRDTPLVSNVVQLTANTGHTCARRSTGTVACWGGNNYGRLGDGTMDIRLAPVAVEGLDDAIDITAAEDFTCATHADHTVGCWGMFGRAVTPIPGAVDVVQLCAGERYACGLQSSGHVICWGAMVPSVAGVDDAVAIGCGFAHACAVRANGSAVCWGQNFGGALGNGTEREGSREAGPVIGLTGAVAITGGSETTCAIRAAGDAVCWGAGFLGDGLEDGRYTASGPSVVGARDVVQMAMADSTCLRRADGRVYCWGINLFGTLGDGTVSPDGYRETRPTPSVAIAGLENILDLAAGPTHLCALRRDGAVWCWGWNQSGQLGDGTMEDRAVPVRVVGL